MPPIHLLTIIVFFLQKKCEKTKNRMTFVKKYNIMKQTKNISIKLEIEAKVTNKMFNDDYFVLLMMKNYYFYSRSGSRRLKMSKFDIRF